MLFELIKAASLEIVQSTVTEPRAMFLALFIIVFYFATRRWIPGCITIPAITFVAILMLVAIQDGGLTYAGGWNVLFWTVMYSVHALVLCGVLSLSWRLILKHRSRKAANVVSSEPGNGRSSSPDP